MAFSIQNMLGADLTAVYTPISGLTGIDYPGPPFAAGTRTVGSDETEWIYCVAEEAITQYNAVGVDLSDGSAGKLTKAMADAGRQIAFCQVSGVDSGEYFWAQTKGQGTITLKNSCLPNVPLYTTASAGMLDDTSASQTRVYGVRSTDTATASGAAKVCWIQGAVT